ncbi:MAG: Ig-like domain-containing protein [Candidatus Bathyarchaeales archaeon]
MRFAHRNLSVLLIALLLLFATPPSLADNYERTFSFQFQYGLLSQKLYVSVPLSLYEYYDAKTPKIVRDMDYAALVTPDAFKPIAERLRSFTCDGVRGNEEFANAVLMLVHQIPYASGDVKYPVETLVENSGKCDTLSLLAASIMKAGGLDVVLLYFKEAHHINVGVYLPYTPRGTWWWLPATGYEFNGRKYWIAECTAAMEWKVGDVPPILAEEQPAIIPLENSEPSSPAHVVANWGSPLTSTSISINLSSAADIVADERRLIISGAITPAHANETVIMYVSRNGIDYEAYRTATDSRGGYSFSWNVTSPGTYYVRTSWSGNAGFAGADSDTLTVFMGFPASLVQFEGVGYYYTYGRAYVAHYELSVRQGVEEFLDVQLSGTGILLTSEFIVLRSGKVITVSAEAEATSVLEKIEIPQGFQPLRLPSDLAETTNNQFVLILQRSGDGNYTVNVKGLNAHDVAQISEQRTAAFMNMSAHIAEGVWYNLTAKITEDEVAVLLHDANGTCLAGAAAADELVMLIANITERAVAFKNLKIEPLNSPAQPPERLETTGAEEADYDELLAPYVNIATVLAATLAGIVYMRRKWREALKSQKACFKCS